MSENEQSLSPLLTLMNDAWKTAESYIAQYPDREWTSQFCTEDANGARCIYLAPWRNEREKVMTLTLLSDQFRRGGVKRYVLASEVWMARYDGGGDPRTTPGFQMPPARSDRVEALMIIGVDPQAGEVLQFNAEIVRKGRRRTLKPRESVPYTGGFSGRMIELLGPVVRQAVN
jgi:hypothetical protein